MTGLIVVDTPAYYSQFGEVVIMGLVQVGGFGIMTLTSLLALLVVRRLGLRSRLIAQAESGTLQLGDVRRVLLGVAILSAVFELIAATVMRDELAVSYDYGAGRAIYHGIFHSVTAFNNAGFALYSDNLIPFATDGWVLTVAGAVIAGGLGFPVCSSAAAAAGPRRWSLHTKLTLTVTGALLAVGFVTFLGFQWSNERTIGNLDATGSSSRASSGASRRERRGSTRSTTGAATPETLLVTDILMFFGTAAPRRAAGSR